MTLRRALVAALALLIAGTAQGQTAEAWTKPFVSPGDVLKHYPATAKAWHAVVPAKYKNVPWIYDLGGVSSETITVTLDGVQYAIGWSCKPRDCHDHAVGFMISIKTRRAVGVLVTMRNNRLLSTEFFGKPTPTEGSMVLSRVMQDRQ